MGWDMKNLFIFIMIILGASVSSAQSVECVTMPMSTSFLFNIDGDTAKLSVIHHNGVEHAPLVNGIVTGYGLDIIKQRLEYVTLMGEQFSVEFDVASCRFDAKDDLACFFKDPAVIGKLEVANYYFSVSKELTQTKHGDFLSHRVSFDYRVGSYGHAMTMDYYGEDCSFN